MRSNKKTTGINIKERIDEEREEKTTLYQEVFIHKERIRGHLFQLLKRELWQAVRYEFKHMVLPVTDIKQEGRTCK